MVVQFVLRVFSYYINYITSSECTVLSVTPCAAKTLLVEAIRAGTKKIVEGDEHLDL